jgi:hypothetical protein
MPGSGLIPLFSFRLYAPTATGPSHFFTAAKVSEPPADNGIGASVMRNMVPQRENSTPSHWSRGDLVKVRSAAADIWRNAYVLIQRGPDLLLVIPEGMTDPDGTRHTRLSLIA